MNTDSEFSIENIIYIEVQKSLRAHNLVKETYLPVRTSFVLLASLELDYLFGGKEGQLDKFIKGSEENLLKKNSEYLTRQADALYEFIKHSRTYINAFVEAKFECKFEEYFAEELIVNIKDKATKEFFTIVFYLQDNGHEYDLPII